MEVTRHFTATTIVVHNNKALLHMHKKLGFWLPVGGHIDRDELPHMAALREAKEESGLDVELLNGEEPLEMGDVLDLPKPRHILLENINKFHQHIDFIYYANSKTSELLPEDGESGDIRWFPEEELKKLTDLPENVVALSLEAIKLFKK
ncbi:MAG: NUDIX domain-containing protein [Patescibacteria group bacterium]|jgi:8-oxo-dGTP pyrophosphatase MutT (NUDIX family)|nr:NUDIX domain-containing protein [Patescibacteria group bacterium]